MDGDQGVTLQDVGDGSTRLELRMNDSRIQHDY